MMQLPIATYRLQLRNGFGFSDAEQLIPYLKDLGISHLYLSPIFSAATGSTHGYDVTDPNTVEPELGGIEGLESLSNAAKRAGLGLIIDIVPNHMAFHHETPWLRDILKHGRSSRYARHFDIDWTEGRLRLPWLEASFKTVAKRGQVCIEGNELVLPGFRLPVSDVESDDLDTIHDAQPYRLTHWRSEASAINHRRFFNVTGLIGVSVELPEVFDDFHELTFDLVRRGVVQGLRLDHIDGLSDPDAYLKQLRTELPDTPIWVEKVLSDSEELRDWPVQGDTGYVACRAITQVLTNGAGAEALAQGLPKFEDVRDSAKVFMLKTELQVELERITELAMVAGSNLDWGRAAWRDAVFAFVRAFPCYRAYTTADKVSAKDAELIQGAAAAGRALALPDLADLLCNVKHVELRRRMQQLTGAAIAKAQEDTAFFRWTPLLSSNEVGAEPEHPSLSVAEFHKVTSWRERTLQSGLTLASSHDTKRSEDSRARILAISHRPEMKGPLCELVPALPRHWQWYLAQTAFAAAPDGDLSNRLVLHMEKAVREAKQDTFWAEQNPEFEAMIADAARKTAKAFESLPDEFSELQHLAQKIGLAQTALRLIGPGIPDIYQGTEVGNYRLGDPDNRCAVDFPQLMKREFEGYDALKFDLTRFLLGLRRDHPDAFVMPWEPLDASADQIRVRRGPFDVRISTNGEDIEHGNTCLWPKKGMPSAPVSIASS